MIMVTHHVEEIAPGFTHVLMIRQGKVLAAGPVETELTSRNLSLCFGLPLVVEAQVRPLDGPGPAARLTRDPRPAHAPTVPARAPSAARSRPVREDSPRLP